MDGRQMLNTVSEPFLMFVIIFLITYIIKDSLFPLIIMFFFALLNLFWFLPIVQTTTTPDTDVFYTYLFVINMLYILVAIIEWIRHRKNAT